MDESVPDSNATRVPEPTSRYLTRVALPVGILGAAALLLLVSTKQSWSSGVEVQVSRVVAKATVTDQDTGDASDQESVPAAGPVQAPGWVEPDPYPIYVTALANGIVKEVLVLEGQRIKKGQTVARLIDEDALLALQRVEGELARREAQLAAAKTNWDQPIAFEQSVAVNRALLAEANAQLVQLDATIAAEQAKLKELEASFNRLVKLLPNAAAELEVEQAKFKLEAQKAQLHQTQKERPVLEARVRRYQAQVNAADADLRLRVTLKQALDEATADVNEGKAIRDEAALRLERMEIKSTIDGIVMTRYVAPGAKIALGMDSPHSAHIAHVYDPDKLQVRVDIPLADAAKVRVGQAAEVVVDVLPDRTFEGQVTRFVHQADIGKNTIQAKVAITAPSSLLKPDMLARVKFLGRKGSDPHLSSASGLDLFVSKDAIERDEDNATVWVVSPGDSTLRRVTVHVAEETDDGHVRVTGALNPGDTVVIHPSANLKAGQAVHAIAQD